MTPAAPEHGHDTPHLAIAAAARGGSRVAVLSSTAHMRAPVDFADTDFRRRSEAAKTFTYKTVGQGAAALDPAAAERSGTAPST